MNLSGDLLQRIDAVNFPAPPSVVMQLTQALANERISAEEIAEEIELDASLTAGLLRLANSVALGGCRDIATVHEAVVRVGLEEVRDIVVALATVGALRPAHFDYAPYWRHSLAVAQIALLLQARSLNLGGRFPEAYSAGLLHDIGMLVLDRVLGAEYHEVLAQAQSSGRPLLAVERETIGVDHCIAGGRLLEIWQFPEVLVDAALRHHEPGASPNPVTHLVHLGDRIYNSRGATFFPSECHEESWDALGIAESDTLELAADVEAAVARAEAILRVVS